MSDGVGGKYDLDYKYNELVADLYRNEQLGFASISVTDSRDNSTTTNTFEQKFPLTGRRIKQEIHLNDGTLVSKTNTAWSHNSSENVIGSYSYSWYTIKKDSEYKTSYNVNGVEIGTFSQLYSQHDIYGNPANVIKSSSDGYQTTIDYAISNSIDWDDYYIGRVTSSSENRKTPDFTETIVRSKEFEYQPDGLLKSEIIEPFDADLYKRTDYSYDPHGRVTSTTQSGHPGATYPVASRTTTTQYVMPSISSGVSGSSAIPFEMEVISTNAENHISKEYIDVRFGHVTRSIDSNGLETISTYDSSGDLLQTVNPDSTITTYTRDTCNQHCPENAVFSVFVNRTGSTYSESYFDMYDRELRARTIGLNNKIIYQDTQFDALGREIYTSQHYFVDNGASLASTKEYDVLGRVKSEYSPEEGLTSYQYNGLNGLGSQITKTQLRSGLNGDTTIQTIYNRNLTDLPVQITNAENNSTSYKYDAFSNLKQTIDPYSNSVTVVYDGLGRTLSLIDPDLGTRTYGVDAFDQIRFKNDEKNQPVTLNYDRLGRLISRNKSEGEDTWEYDNSANAIGKLVSEKSASGSSKSLQYDSLSRIKKETHIIDDKSYVLENGYDFAGRLNKVTYPTGFSVTYNYNNVSGDLESVSNGSTVYWKADSLNAKGERLIESFSNGLTTTTSYNNINGRINSILTGDNNTVQNLTFTFDSIGNLDSRADLNISKDERFSYDNLNRLKDIYLNGTKIGGHDYDAIGNIKTKSDFATNYVYGQNNAGPHAVTEVTDLNSKKITYTYDKNGNMVSGDGRMITPTSFDKPLSVTKGGKTSQFDYDANQMRVKQVNGGEVTTYINPRWDTGVHYEKEQSGSTIKHKHYINAGNVPVALYTTTENSNLIELSFLHKDHLGSVSVITDKNGNVVEGLSYEAFGERRNSDWSKATSIITSETTHHGFTGHEHLDNVGIIHMNARLYDPKLGRFLSADTVIPSKKNLEAFNRYTYVYNNPLSLTDPSGNAPNGSGGIFEWFDRLMSSINGQNNALRKQTVQSQPNPQNVNQSSEGVSSHVGSQNAGGNRANNSGGCSICAEERSLREQQRAKQIEKAKSAYRKAGDAFVEGAVDVAKDVATEVAIGKGIGFIGKFFKFLQPVKEVVVPGRVQSRINIANGRTKTTPLRKTGEPVSAGFDHVLAGHFNRTVGKNRSVFSISPNELKSILQSKAVVGSQATAISGGQFSRTVNVGKIVGITSLKQGGIATSKLRVFTDRSGNLITTYPVR